MSNAAENEVMPEEEEEEQRKLKIPKGAYFILATTLFERMSFYLVEYSLIPFVLDMQGDQALAVRYYNIFLVMIFACTLPAAILADTWTGFYKAWITMAMLSILGLVILLFSSFPVPASKNVLVKEWTLFQIGLYILSFGLGGVKLIQTLGGDQYDPEDQADLISTHFSNAYIIANVGSLFAYFLYPVMQANPLHLNYSEAPFTIPFIVATAFFFLAVILMVSGRPHYKIIKPQRFPNVLDFFRCIWMGCTRQMKAFCCWRSFYSSSSKALKLSSVLEDKQQHHWLDEAEEKFGTYFVSDVKVVLNIGVLFVTYPVFWTLYFQMGTRWASQGTRMKRVLGNTQIENSHMVVVNSALILILVKIFDLFLYPFLARRKLLRKPLQKIVTGGILLSLAFCASAIVESQMIRKDDASLTTISTEKAQILIFNGIPGCVLEGNIKFQDEEINTFHLNFSQSEKLEFGVREKSNSNLTCFMRCNGLSANATVAIEAGKRKSIFIWTDHTNEMQIHDPRQFDRFSHCAEGNPLVKLSYFVHNFSALKDFTYDIVLRKNEDIFEVAVSSNVGESNVTSLKKSGDFKVCLYRQENVSYICQFENHRLLYHDFLHGGSYNVFVVVKNNADLDAVVDISTALVDTIVPPYEVHILWQLPQYVLLTSGEVLFSIPNIQFVYTQAPTGMKSFVLALYHLTIAAGRLIDILLTTILPESARANGQVLEFAIFSVIMTLDMVILALLARKYTYKEDLNKQ